MQIEAGTTGSAKEVLVTCRVKGDTVRRGAHTPQLTCYGVRCS